MKTKDLTTGSIEKALLRLAFPIILIQFIQMSYNLMDIFWLGRLSTIAVSASGTIGLFSWLANALALAPRIGTQIRVAQAIGKREEDQVGKYINNGLKISFFLGIVFTVFFFWGRYFLVSFFGLDEKTYAEAIRYLEIFCLSMIPIFMVPTFSGILNARGNARIPFIANTIGLVVNVILDPIMIFGWFGFPALGIRGAALATVLAQYIVLGIFIYFEWDLIPFLKEKMGQKTLKDILLLGLPTAGQSVLFSFISMVMTRFVANFGGEGIAAMQIGTQIESITWMSMAGFQTALSAFVAQNEGAKKPKRILGGVKISEKIALGIGGFATILFLLASEKLFGWFIPDDPLTIQYGSNYLKIIAFSQIFMALEITYGGLFNGIGRTDIPAYVGMGMNLFRIPVTYFITKNGWSLNYVWGIISLTCAGKGLLMIFFYLRYYKNTLSKQVKKSTA